ncbi:hypothetical protein ACFY2R_17085 [Micromonospora olivasterospora]|uniref:hypothetical protein n=1 Tax=Micromonospora olivasterospora TaxID=1880 RepID=UPI00119F2DDD|nr:hypothetical protein [Micromonospora olivasterospora]
MPHAVSVALGGADLPAFAPTEYADCPAAGWTVETLRGAAEGYAREHGLPSGAVRAAWLAFATAYDLATGNAVTVAPGVRHYGAASLRRAEIQERFSAR